MKDSLTEIRDKIDIAEFIGQYMTLKRAGRNFKGNCPFHNEKTPSFVVSPERQIWHCFGACGEGGDVFKFLMKWENIPFVEAVRELAKKTGVKLADVSIDDKASLKRQRLFAANALAAEYFNYVLFKTKVGEKAHEYLAKRKINDKLAQTFQLGYAPSSWDSLSKFLAKKRFTPDEMYDAGLTVRGERGGAYDRFRGRIVFPIKDTRGNVIGFSGRVLTDDGQAKYVNTPESPIYHKRESLYGIDVARDAIKREKSIYLVEGEFDVLSSFSIGIENIVAIKGSAVTHEQLTLIKRYVPSVILILDSDAAGEEAVRRAAEEAQRLEMEVEVVTLDFAKDPDEAVHKDSTAFKKALKAKLPIYDFIIEFCKKKYPADDPYSKKKVADEVIPFISRIMNPIVKSHYVKKIAAYLDVSEQSVESAMRSLYRKKKQDDYTTSRKPAEENREITLQKYVLSVIFQNSKSYEFADTVFGIVEPEDFYTPAIQKIVKEFLVFQKESPKGFDPKEFVATLDASLATVFDELYLYASIDVGLAELGIERLALEIRRHAIKKRIGGMLKDDGTLSKEEEQKLQEYSAQLKEVEKRLPTV